VGYREGRSLVVRDRKRVVVWDWRKLYIIVERPE
jgi:hypothetical protein